MKYSYISSQYFRLEVKCLICIIVIGLKKFKVQSPRQEYAQIVHNCCRVGGPLGGRKHLVFSFLTSVFFHYCHFNLRILRATSKTLILLRISDDYYRPEPNLTSISPTVSVLKFCPYSVGISGYNLACVLELQLLARMLIRCTSLA